MNKKTLLILLSTLTGISLVATISGVISYKIINKNNTKEFVDEHLEYVEKIIRDNQLSEELFKPHSDGLITPVFTIQESEYINDEQGNAIECTKIGYSLMSDKSIKIQQFPVTVSKVPSELPKHITNLNNAFDENINEIIKGIESWNTSNIRNMSYMFQNASNFNQDIGGWNTSNVTDMSYMFSQSSNFNKNISSWNTKNVVDMGGMFWQAKNFNQDIGSWNTSKVIDMQQMFSGAKKFNQNLSGWDVSKVLKEITSKNEKYSGWEDFNKDSHKEFTGDKLPKFLK
ncbi:Hypothetical protein, predicted transmembrane protein, DUF285 family [Mycoplasma yeatsii 13926]|uniref:PARCEL domain-containing protein n=1 Tax=Mycoplasma yeatsii 13926 TaxID=1188240 RepID=S6G3L1_9MOLU|nr:BspA family leucine-rich repeat surface protein [Mycoplasma yeatsii]EOA07301.1 Hypothetical protein, predicted transmembrane protein, DUF285 family [Mycoplasma yeatsii 13926]